MFFLARYNFKVPAQKIQRGTNPGRQIAVVTTTVVPPYPLIQYPKFTAARKKIEKLKK
jgi:hypothetical protein